MHMMHGYKYIHVYAMDENVTSTLLLLEICSQKCTYKYTIHVGY